MPVYGCLYVCLFILIPNMCFCGADYILGNISQVDHCRLMVGVCCSHVQKTWPQQSDPPSVLPSSLQMGNRLRSWSSLCCRTTETREQFQHGGEAESSAGPHPGSVFPRLRGSEDRWV